MPFSSADIPWADAVAVGGLFAFGATLGSFLNVVAHRMPAGESVVHGGSRCPHCRSPVRPRDNIPVIAWCLLRGRCRDCGGPISPRYPLIEAACGAIVAAVAAADFNAGPGIDALLAGHGGRTIALVALHVWLVTTLVAWGMLAADGHPVGWPAVLVAGLIAAAGVAVVSTVGGPQPETAAAWPGWTPRLPPGWAWIARPLGVGLAWVIGDRCGLRGTATALAVATAVCGWEALPILTVVTLLLQGAGAAASGVDRAAARLQAFLLRAVSVPVAVSVAVVVAHQFRPPA